MRIKSSLVLLMVMIFSASLISQELDVNVIISTPGLKNNDDKIVQELKKSVTEFFNNTKWTDDEYEPVEKIRASLNITIVDDPKSNEFETNLSIQSERPVYKSNYSTIMVNMVDKGVKFTYLPQQNIENATNSYYDHLSATLTMYAYTILGFDYDSFSQFGGEPYFNICQDILNSLPKSISETSNWDVDGKNNKGVMVKNMLSSRFRAYRQAFYEYHRLGLDNMYEDSEKSKAVILGTLNAIKDVNQGAPNSTALQMFSDSKRSEILEIFKQSAKGQQKRVYSVMAKVDPSQASSYNQLK